MRRIELRLSRVIATFLVLSAVSGHAFAALTEEQREALSGHFATLDQNLDQPAAHAALAALTSDSVSPDDMRAFFEGYFKEKDAPSSFAPLWRNLIPLAGVKGAKVAEISAYCSLEALRKSLTPALLTDGRIASSAIAALWWLEEVGPFLSREAFGKCERHLSELIGAAGSSGFGGIIPSPGLQVVDSPAKATLGIQLCLTVADYVADRAAVSSLLKLSGAGQLFWETFGIFLFDNRGLNAAQATSLQSLLRGIPRPLHDVVAIIVPESTGINPAQSQLMTSGQIVYISPVPMGLYTDPAIFDKYPSTGPRFTVNAAQQMVRAIQSTQFRKRPYLAVRRDLILRQTDLRRQFYLHRYVPAEVYYQSPDELLVRLAEMYFVNTGAAFEQGLVQFNLNAFQPLNQFLLFADMMSGGGSTTVAYRMDEFGGVAAEVIPIGRTVVPTVPVPAGFAPANPIVSIRLIGSVWRFALNANGDAYLGSN